MLSTSLVARGAATVDRCRPSLVDKLPLPPVAMNTSMTRNWRRSIVRSPAGRGDKGPCDSGGR